MLRRYDQEERGSDGAMHLDTVHLKLMREFSGRGGRNFSDRDWLQKIYDRSNKTRFEYCLNSKDSLIYIRAVQGHTGGNIIAPELTCHVTIPYNWKEFVFHRGCSFNLRSILEKGLFAGGRGSKSGTQTIFFTPLKPFGENSDEE